MMMIYLKKKQIENKNGNVRLYEIFFFVLVVLNVVNFQF